MNRLRRFLGLHVPGDQYAWVQVVCLVLVALTWAPGAEPPDRIAYTMVLAALFFTVASVRRLIASRDRAREEAREARALCETHIEIHRRLQGQLGDVQGELLKLKHLVKQRSAPWN